MNDFNQMNNLFEYIYSGFSLPASKMVVSDASHILWLEIGKK